MKLIICFLIYLIIEYWYSFENQIFENKQWTAKWIGGPPSLYPNTLRNLSESDINIFKSYSGLKPALYFRKTFEIEARPRKATLYYTARGIVDIYLNHESAISDDFFPTYWTPGWTDYNKTIQYYIYDATEDLKFSTHYTIGIVLGSGWYSGYIGGEYNWYGSENTALLELHIEYQNGSTTVITSDENWKVNTGAVLYSDLSNGELFYENRILRKWTNYTYSDNNWLPVVTQAVNKSIKFVSDNHPIRAYEEEDSKHFWEVGNDTWIYGFDDLYYGGIVISLSNFKSTARVQVRFGESLYPNGTLYTGKNALMGNTYVLNDPANRPDDMILQPLFSAHTFRYVEISGFPTRLHHITAQRIGGTADISVPKTDNNLITKMFPYFRLCVSANMISVPTVAASADNRVGWLEPAGLFSSTVFNQYDFRNLYKKWLEEIWDSQTSSGAYSDIVPNLNSLGDASPGSGFAPILIAYNIFKYFENKEELETSYIPNHKWMTYVISNNPNFLYTNNLNENYGDYANLNADTPKEVIATAYFAYSCLLMSKMAKVLRKSDDQVYYENLHKNISSAFVKAYVNAHDSTVNGDTQTGYVMALVSRVLPADLIPKAAKKLVDNIKAHDYHLTTGYVGTAFVLPVLADYGHADVAYKLLLQESYPSWGYMFKNPRTSGFWERWNYWTDKDGFQNSSANSIGLATVGNFLYQYIAGINSDEEHITLKYVVIKPYIGEGINSFSADIRTKYGRISSSWNIVNSTFNIEIILPRITRGKLILPFAKRTWIREISQGRQVFEFALNENN